MGCILELLKVLVCKVSLENAEKRRGLVADLMECDQCACPGSLAHVVSIVSFLLAELSPALRVVQILDTRLCFDVLCHSLLRISVEKLG